MRPLNNRTPAVILMIATTFMFFMLLSHQWQTLGIDAGGVGPLGLAACDGSGNCSWAWWGSMGLTGSLPTLAIVALIGLLFAFAFSFACGVLAFGSRAHSIPHRSARVFLLVGIAAAGAWQVAVSTNTQIAKLTYFEISNVGYAGILCVVTMIVAFVCVRNLARQLQRPQYVVPPSGVYAAVPGPFPGWPVHAAPTIAAPPAPPGYPTQPTYPTH